MPGVRARPGVTAALLLVAALVVTLVVLALRGPGEDAAREVAEDYLAERVAGDCRHYAYYTEAFARAEHVDVKDCQADEALAAGEYIEYDVVDVRVDGVRAEVDVEDESDAPSGPFTLVLAVEEGAWRINGIERHED